MAVVTPITSPSPLKTGPPEGPGDTGGDSGIGREGGWESFHDFTHVRAVTIRTDSEPVDWYGGQIGRLN